MTARTSIAAAWQARALFLTAKLAHNSAIANLVLVLLCAMKTIGSHHPGIAFRAVLAWIAQLSAQYPKALRCFLAIIEALFPTILTRPAI